MQALSRGQSLFKIHSGRHSLYGSPWYSGRHVQIPSEHSAFGPHGEGLQGSRLGGSGAKIKVIEAGLVILTRQELEVLNAIFNLH